MGSFCWRCGHPVPGNGLSIWRRWPGYSWLRYVSFDGWSAMGLRVLRYSAFALGGGVSAAAGGGGRERGWPDSILCISRGLPVLVVQALLGLYDLGFSAGVSAAGFRPAAVARLLPTKKAAVMAAAGLFAFAHLPNPILTPVTLIWGLPPCWLFLRYRNLYTLALAHAIFGICIATTVPGPITHHMKVGLGLLDLSSLRTPSSQPEKLEPPRRQDPRAANLPELSLRPES